MDNDDWLDDELNTTNDEQPIEDEQEEDEEEEVSDDPLFPELQTASAEADDEDDLLEGLTKEQLDLVTQRVLKQVTAVSSRQSTVGRILSDNLPEQVLDKWRPLIEASVKTIDNSVPIEPWHVYGSAYVAAMQSLPRKNMSMREVHEWIGRQFGLDGSGDVGEYTERPKPRVVQPTARKAPQNPKQAARRPVKRTGNIYMDSLAASIDITAEDFAEISAGRRR